MKTEAPDVSTEFGCAVCGARLDTLHVDAGLEGDAVCSFCGSPLVTPNGSEDWGVVVRHDRPPVSLVEISALLRDARARRGVSLNEAARDTGIREKYLEELEAGGGSFEPYPGRVYGRFFLRGYAEYLGIQPGPLIHAFDIETRAEGWTRSAQILPRRARHWVAAPLGGLVCLALVLTVSAILVADVGDPPTVATRDAAVPRVRAHPHAPETVDTIRAVATVVGPTWIEATSDGRPVYRATAPAGTELRLEADRRLELTLGNAGGVQLEVNRRAIQTGPVGEVVHLTMQRRNDGFAILRS